MGRLRAAGVLAALATAGCLGRSLATDTGRITVTWILDADYGCELGGPMVRIRSATVGGAAIEDDEEIDWVPCFDVETGTRSGTTAPLGLATYSVSAELALEIDGEPVAASTQTPQVTLMLAGDRAEITLTLQAVLPPLMAPDRGFAPPQ